MARVVVALLLILALGCSAARAITHDEIPDDVRRTLPEFLLMMLDPQTLAYLSADDLREFAAAYDNGGLRFVSDVRIEQAQGPLDPQLAQLLLQIPPGAPYIEERFVRIARAAYGKGIFSSLEWAVYPNADGSVSIHLWYSSRGSELLAPDVSYNALAGYQLGLRYEDFYYGGENKQLKGGFLLSEDYMDEPRVNLSWTDATLHGGRNSWFASTMVSSDWRQRLYGTANQANIRTRTSRLDSGYSWHGVNLGSLGGAVTLGGGVYDTDYAILAGDPAMDGTMPRSNVTQAGTGVYGSLAWSGARKDMMFTPRRGYHYLARAEQHAGDFEFTRFTLDLRRYTPLRNVLGHRPQRATDNERLNIRRQFPTASLGLQFQLDLEAGDVPYSQEIRVSSAKVARGFSTDSQVGTKLVSGRAEYRFNLDEAGDSEAFVFSDHAGLGEDFDDMEAFHSYGVGTLLTVPLYGGFKLGGFMGWSYDGSDSGWGLSFGYQF